MFLSKYKIIEAKFLSDTLKCAVVEGLVISRKTES